MLLLMKNGGELLMNSFSIAFRNLCFYGYDKHRNSFHLRHRTYFYRNNSHCSWTFSWSFFSIGFVVATVYIIYFKLISEAYIDRDKYRILEIIGMTDKEALRAVGKQIGISYLLPLVVGIIHSCVDMSLLSELMNYNIIVRVITSIITFSVIYGIYFIATTRKYLKIVM